MFELKEEEKENVTENENHEYKATVQRTQSDHNHDVYNINNRSVKSISDKKIIERKKNFSFIKFSSEGFSSTRH